MGTKHNIKRSVVIGFVLFGLIMALVTGYFFGSMNQYDQVREDYSQLFPSPTPDYLDAHELTALVNQWRIDNDMKPFKESTVACEVASRRISQVKTSFDHDGFYGIAQEYADKLHQDVALAENLASEEPTAEETLRDWLASPPHKANLDKSFPYMCIVASEFTAVQIFSSR